MKSIYAKLIRVALLYGGVCFLVSWGVSVLGWQLFPDQLKDDDFTIRLHWVIHMASDKVVGLLLLSVTAFLASRAHHPTWKWGVVTGMAAAVAYQLFAVLVYVVRFGLAAYQLYNRFLYTMLCTALLAWLFGYLAVRRQHLHDKRAA